MTHVYYNDIDPYCCAVLRKNIQRGNLPQGVIDERDIRTVRADELASYQHIHLFAGIGGFPLGIGHLLDGYRILTGGFPCQPHSLAGKRQGSEDERDLWGEFYRIICGIRPDYVLAENVYGLLSSESGRFFGRILRDLATCGYDAEWEVLRASDFGAIHQRERVFLIAYPGSERVQGVWTQTIQRVSTFSWCKNVRRVEDMRNRSDLPEPLFRGARDGIPRWVDRLRSLGNSIVPQCAEHTASSILARTRTR